MDSKDIDKIETGRATTPPPSESASVHAFDDNYHLYAQAKDAAVDPDEAKKVLRKIDLRVLPILFVTYTLQYLDKNSINFAATFGLQKGTHLKGQDYSWLGTGSLHRPLLSSVDARHSFDFLFRLSGSSVSGRLCSTKAPHRQSHRCGDD